VSRASRAVRLFVLMFVVYFSFDFCEPFLPGAFNFDADQTIKAVVKTDLEMRSPDARGTAMPLPEIPDALRVVEATLARAPQPRRADQVGWVVVLRRTHSLSADRPSGSEAH